MKTSEEIYRILIHGIRQFFNETGKKQAVVGLSGGIDSAVVACLAQDALGKENVHGLMMPGPYSTVHSLTDALKLCTLSEIAYHIIPIDPIFHKFLRELSPVFEHAPHDVTEENIQARIRAVLLMAYSNKKGHLVLNTSNKSELAMGYGTLYGDLTGALMVIGDIYKTDVYDLAAYLNRNGERIPDHTIKKEPSAELHIDQKDSDNMPEYEELDPILYGLIEEARSADDTTLGGGGTEKAAWVAQKMKQTSYKGHQLPPLLAVTDHPLLPEYKCLRYNS